MQLKLKMGAQTSKDKISSSSASKLPDYHRERFGSFGKKGNKTIQN